MLRHIVMVKMKECENKKMKHSKTEELLAALNALSVIPEVKYLQVGLNVSTKPSAQDLVLVTDFNSASDLEKYRIHPDHVKVIDLVIQSVEKTAVVDFEY